MIVHTLDIIFSLIHPYHFFFCCFHFIYLMDKITNATHLLINSLVFFLFFCQMIIWFGIWLSYFWHSCSHLLFARTTRDTPWTCSAWWSFVWALWPNSFFNMESKENRLRSFFKWVNKFTIWICLIPYSTELPSLYRCQNWQYYDYQLRAWTTWPVLLMV